MSSVSSPSESAEAYISACSAYVTNKLTKDGQTARPNSERGKASSLRVFNIAQRPDRTNLIPMITDKLNELAAAKAKIAKLEATLEKEIRVELRNLPAKYGFSDTGSFFAAVKAAHGASARRPKATSAGVPVRERRRKRAKITDATRQEVKRLANAGRTGSEIAKAVGISLPSVQNIKKALGLVKARK
jgi:hypothetical protein